MGEREVMGVLGRFGLAHGIYTEAIDGIEWLTIEAADVYAAIEDGRDPAIVLDDTGFWPENFGPFPDQLRRDLLVASGHGGRVK